MMKKLVLGVTIAALVGVSSSCFAGFGVPKMPGAKAEKPAATEQKSEAAAPVDLSDITNKQGQILKYMCGGLYAQIRAYQVVDEALGNSDPKLAQAAEGLKGQNNKAVKSAKTVLANKTKDKKAIVAMNDEQKAKLAQAIKTGKVYQQAAIVNYGFVAANVPGAMSEASSAVKNLTKNPTAMNKVNGAIATFKLGGELAGGAQAVAGDYNAAVDTMKSDYGVSDEVLAAAKSADVNTIANECLDFVNGK